MTGIHIRDCRRQTRGKQHASVVDYLTHTNLCIERVEKRISEETAETKNCFAIFGSEITHSTVRIMIIHTTRVLWILDR